MPSYSIWSFMFPSMKVWCACGHLLQIFPLWEKEQEPKIKNNYTEETQYDPILRKRLSLDKSFWEGISATNSRQIPDSPPFVELSAKQAPPDNTESIQGRRQFQAIRAWNARPESGIYCMPWEHEILTSTLKNEQGKSKGTCLISGEPLDLQQ